MVVRPAGLGGVGWGEEVAGAAEVLRVDEAEALDEVLARGVEVIAAAVMGARVELAEDGEVEGAWSGGV